MNDHRRVLATNRKARHVYHILEKENAGIELLGTEVKAIRAGKSWELYDLRVDPTEMNNLAEEHPEKTGELAEMWERWNASSVGNR